MEGARSNSTGAISPRGPLLSWRSQSGQAVGSRKCSKEIDSRRGSKDSRGSGDRPPTSGSTRGGIPLAVAFHELGLRATASEPRPGSASGSKASSSLTRLPDDAVDPAASKAASHKEPANVRATSSIAQASTTCSSRPLSSGGSPKLTALDKTCPGMIRLADEPTPSVSATGQRPESISSMNKVSCQASLALVEADNPPDSQRSSNTLKTGEDVGTEEGQRGKESDTPEQGATVQGLRSRQGVNGDKDITAEVEPRGVNKAGGGMRDRMKMNLAISTVKPEAETKAAQHKAKIFTPLKEGEQITDFFDFGEDIYNGGEKGKVLMAKTKKNGTEVVVKLRVKSIHTVGERAWRTIMSQFYGMGSSEHVLDIIDIYEDDIYFYIIMPKCNGGELFDFLATETEVPEGECKRIIREILTAIGHLHENGMVHRDIKPENIMLNLDQSDPASPKTVKLIDFDTCVGWQPGSPNVKRFVGTPGYIAPEALLGEVCPQSDLWSIGVILYILMTGEMPWTSLSSLEDGIVGSQGCVTMYEELKSEVMDWDNEPWPEFPLAKDLCKKLLAFSVNERVGDVQEALAHPWLSGENTPGVKPADDL